MFTTFFNTLFVVIARFFLKIWPNYKNWYSNVRYGLFLLFFSNVILIYIYFSELIGSTIYTTTGIFLLIFVFFFNGSINNKEFIENYKFNVLVKKIAIYYIFFCLISIPVAIALQFYF